MDVVIVADLGVILVEWPGQDALDLVFSRGSRNNISSRGCIRHDAIPITRRAGFRPSGPLDSE